MSQIHHDSFNCGLILLSLLKFLSLQNFSDLVVVIKSVHAKTRVTNFCWMHCKMFHSLSSFNHLFIQSFVQYYYSFICSFHSIIYSLIYSFIQSFVHSIISFFYSPIYSCNYSFIYSTQSFINHQSNYSVIYLYFTLQTTNPVLSWQRSMMILTVTISMLPT